MLKNKVVFITGGASGIGGAITSVLLKQGAKIFNLSRASTLPNSESIISVRGDVGSETDVKSAFKLCLETFKTVDILINNAGVGIPTPDLAEATLDVYETMVNTNMRGVFLCNREALKIMKHQQSGHIITIVSMAAQRTNPNAPLYCASKFGARGLMGGMADQVLKDGIKVTEINPGPVDSNYWGDRQVDRDKFLTVDDVARVVLFTLSQPNYIVIREINFDNIKHFSR